MASKTGTKQEILEALEVSQHALMKESIDAERYRKLQAWCLEHHVELWPSWGTPYESFDAAVDALPPASAQERDA